MKLRPCSDLCPDRSVLGQADDLRGWNSTHPIFAKLIAEAAPRYILELGTWKGASALHMAHESRELGTEIVCVDTWLGATDHLLSEREVDDLRPQYGYPTLYHQFLHNVLSSGAARRIFPIPNTTTNACRFLQKIGFKAELIYIDASHAYEDVYYDLLAAYPLLLPHGILFGDDFTTEFTGVKTAVHRFAGERNLLHRLEIVASNYWVIRT